MNAATRRASLQLPYTHVDDFYINGSWVKAEGTQRNPVVDPAVGQEWGSVPEATASELDSAVGAARTALKSWSALTGAERTGYLLKIATEIESVPKL